MSRNARTPRVRPPLGVELEPDVENALVEHSLRGLRVQGVLRLTLAVFALCVVIVVPPARAGLLCLLLAIGYAGWALAIALVTRRGNRRVARHVWATLIVDIAALSTLTVVAAASDRQSWTEDLLLAGFVVLPVLAAAQLRPRVCALIAAATTAAYFIASASARAANDQPWSVVVLGSGVLIALGVGCVLLSQVQRSRVLAIGHLAADRTLLLADVNAIEQRERCDLAENLHDGALQYVLSARQDLADVRSGDPDALARIEYALRESARLLRATVSDLHPAVLAHAGLPVALHEITVGVAERASLQASVRTEGWPAGVDPADEALLFGTARELLTNVAKHAQARSVDVTLEAADGRARLTVADDGIGFDDSCLPERLAQGHIGLASRRTRLAGAGGRLVISSARTGGTSARVELPIRSGTINRPSSTDRWTPGSIGDRTDRSTVPEAGSS